MGFLDSLFGRSRGPGNGKSRRFVSDTAFHKNLAKQSEMSPQTVEQLRNYGVTDQTLLKLEFFFYTDADEKGVALGEILKSLGYQVECRASVDDCRQFLVTGWTIPVQMDVESVVAWTRTMCRLGYDHDCDFDGWGTNPEQGDSNSKSR